MACAEQRVSQNPSDKAKNPTNVAVIENLLLDILLSMTHASLPLFDDLNWFNQPAGFTTS